jgi:hypothetical protein
MGFKKFLNAVSPVASVVNKSGPVAKMLGMEKKKAVARPMNSGVVDMVKKGQAKNALQEGQARIAPKKMSKGGKVKSGSSASRRADGCAVKGKTRGRMV